MNNHQRQSVQLFELHLEQHQKNFMLYMVPFAISIILIAAASIFGWNTSAVIFFCLVIALVIAFFRPRAQPVIVTLDGDRLGISERSNKKSDQTMLHDFDLSDCSSVTAHRSGRFAELLRVVLKTTDETTTLVFSSQPSPKESDPIRRLEQALKNR